MLCETVLQVHRRATEKVGEMGCPKAEQAIQHRQIKKREAELRGHTAE